MTNQPDPVEAARALTEIQRRQEQVIDTITIPAWYFWAVAGLGVVLGIGVDRRDPPSVGIATAIYVVGMVGATLWVTVRPALRAQLRNDLLGARGVLAILGFVAVIVPVTIGTAFALRGAGFPLPATGGAIVGGVLMVLGAPWLRRYLRAVMLGNRTGVAR